MGSILVVETVVVVVPMDGSVDTIAVLYVASIVVVDLLDLLDVALGA